MFNVTCENQRRDDEHIPILLEQPFKHKGIMFAPFIGPVSIDRNLPEGQIKQVLCDGENCKAAPVGLCSKNRSMISQYRNAPALSAHTDRSASGESIMVIKSCGNQLKIDDFRNFFDIWIYGGMAENFV